MAFQRLLGFNFFRLVNSRPTPYSFILISVKSLAARGIASFLNSCKPGWLVFPHILKIARITITHWPHQQVVEWSNQKFVGPGLLVYGLAMPLATVLHDTTVKNCSTNKTVLLFVIHHYLQGSTRGCTRISELYSEWNAWRDVTAFPVGFCAWQRYMSNSTKSLLFFVISVGSIYYSLFAPQILHKLLSSNVLGKMQYSQEHLKTMVYAKFGGQR